MALSSCRCSIIGLRFKVIILVNEAPIRRSSSILVATAFACLSSSVIGFFAARITCLRMVSITDFIRIRGKELPNPRSMLLNLALLTSRLLLTFNAMSRISVPMCSPSLSQSVQMNRPLAYLAWVSMFFAIDFLSCFLTLAETGRIGPLNATYSVNGGQDRCIE